MDHSGASEMQVKSAPSARWKGNSVEFFHLLVGRKRASMDLWLTATERNTLYGHCGVEGDGEPAPGERGGYAQEVSGGVSGRNAMQAPGAPVPADCVAFAGIGRRRSLREGARAGASDRAGFRLASDRATRLLYGGRRARPDDRGSESAGTRSPPATRGT